MVKCEVSHKRNELEQLEERVREGVGDVCFQPGEAGLVIESTAMLDESSQNQRRSIFLT